MKIIAIVLIFILITSMGFAGLDLTLYDKPNNPYVENVDRIVDNPFLNRRAKAVALSVFTLMLIGYLIYLY